MLFAQVQRKGRMKRKILLIGDIRQGKPPVNGEQVKNQLLSGYLRKRHILSSVDTDHWKSRPWVIIRTLWETVFGNHDTVILSASSGSVHNLLALLKTIRVPTRRIVYLVVGGYVHIGIQKGRFKAKNFNGLKAIVMQGEAMGRSMRALGITSPLLVMPNSKPILKTYGNSERYSEPSTRFLFLGRISEPKGTLLVFKALQESLLSGRSEDLTVDFYGTVEKGHETDFFTGLEHHPNCHYRGYLDITGDPAHAYDVLSSYHAMLFPTSWVGEGFPGVIIDAYVAGLPVIASDWNMNSEVVKDGVTGLIIPDCGALELSKAMASVMDERERWSSMSRACHEAAISYDTDKVLSQHLEPLL